MEQQVTVQRKKFSWKARAKSFVYAFQGLKALFRTEHNARIHAWLTVFVVVLSFLLHITMTEWILLILATTLVWTMEIINTALEKAMDFISLEKLPQIGLVKDLAAAAVLLSAVAAFLTGTLIFLPKLLQYV
ncbi:MAG: diacylglycerol kinase family protein [Chitinophagaceae bacterium]|nr:MAG: diacylglycerol kinase family protein [Chitinophagaceae bacterium]